MSNAAPPATRYPDLATAARELAGRLADTLRAALAARGIASLVVSGGKSPAKLFESLRTQALDWRRVRIALVDERWVAPSDPDSNERFVHEHLLQDAAAAAHFSGLKNDAPTPDLGAAAAWKTLTDIPRPFDVVLLGMGDDGHTASLFPHSPHLEAAIDPAAAPAYVGMQSPTAPRGRLSLNLSALLDSRRIVLFLNGESKWRVYVAASQSGPVEEMPVRTVLRQRRTPLDVNWSP